MSRQYDTSIDPRYNGTGHSWPVFMSFYKHYTGPILCEWHRGRSKLACWVAGSSTKWKLTTWTESQFSLKQLVMSIDCHNIAVYLYNSHSRWLESAFITAALQVVPASFITKLFLIFNLPAVFVRCSLYVSVQSWFVTPRALSNFSPTRGFDFAYWKIVKFIFQH